MSRALLDINVLLALLDSDHVDHGRAQHWLAGNFEQGWASCAVTENGFVRIISQPRYPNPITTAHAIGLLAQATDGGFHERWSTSVSLLDPANIDPTRVLGPKQVTDAYLLALAVDHGGRFVTFDAGVPTAAVPGASAEHLVVLS